MAKYVGYKRPKDTKKTVKHADQIIILDRGCVNAIGTHDELLKNNKIYQEIYESQKEGADL